MGSSRAGTKLYALSAFGLLSLFCGLLVAGLALPVVLVTTHATNATADGLDSLPAELTITPQFERSQILMKDGSVLAQFYDQNRVYENLAHIAPIMQKAQVGIEDDQFFHHGPISIRGVVRAALHDSAGGGTQGASTLTQQFVKQTLIENAIADGDRNAVDEAQAPTPTRKIREMRYAIAVEKKLTKNDILERYLNIAYYGDGAYGVEAAARHYFGVSAAKLNLAQAALLAGIVQSPDAYNPVVHPAAALNRRNIVLARLRQLNIISAADQAAAKKVTFDKSKVKTSNAGCFGSKYPFICQYAYNTVLQNMTSLGKTPEERKDELNRGGLTIRTVIDPAVQDSAQHRLNSFVAPTDPVIAVGVTVQPGTGLITTMVQNRPQMGTKPGQTYINYAVQQSMGGAEGFQAGSTFKAFTMAAAFEQGMSAGTSYNSPSPMDFSGLSFQGCQGRFNPYGYHPGNDDHSGGYYNMRQAIDYSVNTYFVQLERAAGLCNVIKTAEKAGAVSALGFNMEQKYGSAASFTLGVPEVTPLSMASAYATFAAHGKRCDPIILATATKKNANGKATDVAVPSANCTQALDASVADKVTRMLTGVMSDSRATGLPARVSGYEYQAGKTGTTEGHQTVWFDGFTANVAGAAMISADKMAARFRNTTNRDLGGVYVHGTDCTGGCGLSGFGGSDAGRVWREVMVPALKGTDDTPFASVSVGGGTASSSGRVSLPDVSGMTMSGARAALEAAGFSVTTWRISSSYPAGTFLGTSPRSSATPGSTIALLVSSGYSYTNGGSGGSSGSGGSGRSTSGGTTSRSTATATATHTSTHTASSQPTTVRSTAVSTATSHPTTKKP